MQLPVNVEELLQRNRDELSSRLSAPAGDLVKIGTDKTFTFPNGDETAGPFEAVILDYQYLNEYYEGAFVRGKPNRALCYANGSIDTKLVPADDSPEKQAESCAKCPNNQFGSAGNGKACKNRVVVAFLPPNADVDTPIHIIKLPPTAIKHFAKYMRTITKTARKSPIELVTMIGFDPDSSYATPMFEPATEIVNDRRAFRLNPALASSIARAEEARTRLEEEKPDISEKPVEEPARRGGKK